MNMYVYVHRAYACMYTLVTEKHFPQVNYTIDFYASQPFNSVIPDMYSAQAASVPTPWSGDPSVSWTTGQLPVNHNMTTDPDQFPPQPAIPVMPGQENMYMAHDSRLAAPYEHSEGGYAYVDQNGSAQAVASVRACP